MFKSTCKIGACGKYDNEQTMTVRFRRPRRSENEEDEHKDQFIFPPTVYTDAKYTKGILIPEASPVNDEEEEEEEEGITEEVSVQMPQNYFRRDDEDCLPILTENEVNVWNHNIAASCAANRRFPMQVGRLLGTITLYFDERQQQQQQGKKQSKATTLYNLSRKYCHRNDSAARKGADTNCKLLSRKQAMNEARLEMAIGEDIDETSLPLEVQRQLQTRSEEIFQFWKDVRESEPIDECWSKKDGSFVTSSLGASFLSHVIGDEFYVPIPCLLDWISKNDGCIEDLAAGRVISLYGGLRHVATDATSVLESLVDLSDTKTLYKIPLITPYAMASCIAENATVHRWKIRIGVYMNRLLPEVLTSFNLHCVMSALDEHSYIVSEPLHLPPMSNDAVFESSKYPIVRFPGIYDETYDDEDDVSMCEEKKEDDDDAPRDLFGSTRETETISPFTAKGLLKLMEEHSSLGNDVSKWDEIAQSLLPYVKLDLMLHQQHCVCWMKQMEGLEGFGINSMLWEEREFLDGGNYYYSPALGQIRLTMPPKTVGGCVADEMGLGKTLQMLCLIASSLDELKQEAKNSHDDGNQATHATLIIVPPSLVMQWFKEVKKSCGDTLIVDILDANKSTICTNGLRIGSGGTGSDILITTYNALEKSKSIRYLSSWAWGRVVLDEQQEIRSSTTKIAQNCESLDCHRRWMLSGTPIFEGVEDLKGELNFLRLTPFAAKYEDGFFNFSVMNHWNQHSLHGLETLRVLGLLMLRRGKSMTIRKTGAPIMQQRKLTIEAVPVAQSPSERALYCWFEALVSKELNRSEGSNTKSSLKSRTQCLRLLGSICLSPVMINGGLGAQSRLKELNEMIRRKLQNEGCHERATHRVEKRVDAQKTLSCDGALSFLSQYEKTANVGDEFVTEQQFRGGGGAAARARATLSVEEQCQQAREMVHDSTNKAAEARCKRAKAHWHLAMELITTGRLCDDELIGTVSPDVLSVWKLRRGILERSELSRSTGSLFNRCWMKCFKKSYHTMAITTPWQKGWRPCLSFSDDLLQTHPNFEWLHDNTLRLDSIPIQVAKEEIVSAIFEASKTSPRARSKLEQLQKRHENENKESEKMKLLDKIDDAQRMLDEAVTYDSRLEKPTVIKIPNLSTWATRSESSWMAFVRVRDEKVQKQVMQQAGSKTGIMLPTSITVPHIQAAIDDAIEKHKIASAEHNVHPCAENKKRKVEAQKILDRARIGLTIKSGSASQSSTSNNVVVLTRAFRLRTFPQTRDVLVSSCSATIDQANIDLERALSRLEEGRSTLERMAPALSKGLSQDFAQKSAFDILQSLKRKEFQETTCTICLGHLGGNFDINSEEMDEPVVSMISCGHFFCTKCLDDHIHSEISKNKQLTCPICRGKFNKTSDVSLIDHNLSDDEENERRREEAKTKVLIASDMLASSEGVALDGELWNALYLAIPLPTHVSHDPHHLHTALPRDFLAHVRAATAMTAGASRTDKPFSWSEQTSTTAGLSSKIQQLLHDLPMGEHAVVFSTTKDNVIHLETVLKAKLGDDEVFSLYTGQDTKATEKAVSTWSSRTTNVSRRGPTLIVQAGAAASGLTLTTASKLFIMEPFNRQEEEQQAYARLHRYGQKNDVHVKIYYAPVSVESRLLVWRRRSAEKISSESNGDDAQFVYNNSLFENDLLEDDEGADEESLKSADGDDGSSVDKEVGGSDEDDMRTQFLLGLVDEEGMRVVSNTSRDDEEETDYDDAQHPEISVSGDFILE